MSDKAPEPEESLSATAMFLRALQSAPPQTPGESHPSAPAPIRPEPIQPPQSTPGEPGEFTRMFRAVPTPEPPRAAPPPQPGPLPLIAPQPVPPPAITSGEFTRAFVVPSPPEPPPVAPTPTKSKGFSTPGLSDSVSTEGSCNRAFQSTSQPQPEPSYPPPTSPPPSNFTTSAWQPTPVPSQPQPTAPPPASFTSIFNTLSSSSEPSEQPRASSPSLRPNPDPTYALAPPVQRSPTQATPTGGGITQLINLLSEGPSAAATSPIATSPTSVIAEPTRSADEEFLRITQPSNAVPARTAAPTPPLAAPGPMSSSLVLPAAIKPIAPPKLPAQPKLPTAALPAIPALPKTKLQEMIPLLLVANAFLMLILIVLVIFMLHRR